MNDKFSCFSPPLQVGNLHLCRQVDKDCDFLEQERIMDYSMLVGLHFREDSQKEQNMPNGHHSVNFTPNG